MRIVLIAAMTAIAVSASQAAEKVIELKPGPGLDKVVANCSACHSLDYVPMNSPFLDVAGWNAEVAKMINAFGAPIDQADAKTIAEYLGANYGLRPQTAGLGTPEGKRQLPRSRIGSRQPKGLAPSPPQREPKSVLSNVDAGMSDHGGERTGRE
jgi:sulfite dehydrogenase (cytochrome) subunit B